MNGQNFQSFPCIRKFFSANAGWPGGHLPVGILHHGVGQCGQHLGFCVKQAPRPVGHPRAPAVLLPAQHQHWGLDTVGYDKPVPPQIAEAPEQGLEPRPPDLASGKREPARHLPIKSWLTTSVGAFPETTTPQSCQNHCGFVRKSCVSTEASPAGGSEAISTAPGKCSCSSSFYTIMPPIE